MTRIVHRFVVRTWGLAFLLAVVATVGAAREAAAHSLGPKFFAQQITVKMDAEWLRIAYTIEVPTSILQREFVDMAKDKMDAPPAEIREEFKRSKVDALRTGLDVSLNREHLTLEDDPDGVRESRPNDMYFQLYRYALRTKIAGKLADRNVLAIKNRNYPGEETLYSEHVELGDGLGEARTGLEKDERFFLDSKTNTKWYPSPEHRNLSIDFTRKGVALPEAAGAPAAAAPVPGQAAASDDKAAARTSHEVKRMESYLGAANLSVSVVLVGLAVAFFLGCGHALSPGHGKTVVAAYLVGSKGRIRDAVFLGTVVTATHTSVVILLGVITLSLSQYVLPEKIYPYLGFTSGALIVGLGFWMLVIRLRAMMGGGHTHGHGHADHDHHLHDHTHGHDHAHDRDHGHDHAHPPPRARSRAPSRPRGRPRARALPRSVAARDLEEPALARHLGRDGAMPVGAGGAARRGRVSPRGVRARAGAVVQPRARAGADRDRYRDGARRQLHARPVRRAREPVGQALARHQRRHRDPLRPRHLREGLDRRGDPLDPSVTELAGFRRNQRT
ncbi:MAG: hypothetical protein IPK07_19205 [Deltaproteobacteria bacterium]|nr:hypothetical protein [Deltaproteobacteria bacterium]